MSIAPPLLSVEGLSKSYGGVHAVRRVSFQLKQGEILALIGANGAGKSTCFDMLNGQTTASAGRIKSPDTSPSSEKSIPASTNAEASINRDLHVSACTPRDPVSCRRA